MKKILSAIVVCAMILTMVVPMTAFAAADATISGGVGDVSTIHFADYYTDDNLEDRKGIVTNSAGQDYIRVFYKEVESNTELTVSVAKSGTYNLEYALTDYKSGDTVSKVSIKLDDTVLGDNLTEVDVLNAYPSDFLNNEPMCKFVKNGVHLDAGEYTLSLVPEKAIAGTYKDVYLYMADYIKFTCTELDPEPVQAVTISGSEDTTIHFANYYADSTKIVKNTSGQDYIKVFYKVATSEETTAQVTVAETGTYNLEYALTDYKSGDTVSKVSIKLDDTVLGDNATEVDVLSGYAANYYNGEPMCKFVKEGVELTAGTYELKLIAEMATGGTYKDCLVYMADYIKFTPVAGEEPDPEPEPDEPEVPAADVTIAADAPTTISLGNYTDKVATNNDKTYVKVNGSATEGTTSLTVEIAESGNYDLEYAVTTYNTQKSKVSYKLDGTVIADNTEGAGEDLSGYGSFVNGYAMVKHTKSNVALTAGVYTFTLDADVCEDGTYKDWYLFQADYITFTPAAGEEPDPEPDPEPEPDEPDEPEVPAADVTLSTSEATRIEAETYSSVAGATFSGASNGQVIKSNWGTTKPVIQATVAVPADGAYTIKYVASKDLSPNCVITFKLGDVVLGTNAGDGIGSDNLAGYANFAVPLREYSNVVNLTAGTYTLDIDVAASTVSGYEGCFQYLVDYIEFVPPVPADATIAAEGTTSISLGSYSDKAYENTSEGKTYVRVNGNSAAGTTSLTVEVAETGTYTMKYALTQYTADKSKVSIKLNDTVIADNAEEGAVALEGYSSSFYNGAGVYEFTKTVELTAGTYTLSLAVDACESGTYKEWFVYQADYITFEPAADEPDEPDEPVVPTESFAIADGTATATVIYDAPVSGKVFMALYNGNKFVGVGEAVTADNVTTVTVTAAVSGTVTRAKVFAWEDLVNIKPLKDAKEFFNN